MTMIDVSRTFQGQIPDLPNRMSLFELAMKASDAYFNDAMMYKRAEETGRFPPELAYQYGSDKVCLLRPGYCHEKAEESRAISGALQQWAVQVGVDGWDWDSSSHDDLAEETEATPPLSGEEPDGIGQTDDRIASGLMDELEAAYRASPVYARAQQLLLELGERTDLERVLFKANTADVVLAEQDATVGYHDGTFIIEVTGTLDVRVALVAEAYFDQAAYIIPDWHVSITWKTLSKMQRRTKAALAKKSDGGVKP